jgi:hypothetical protein
MFIVFFSTSVCVCLSYFLVVFGLNFYAYKNLQINEICYFKSGFYFGFFMLMGVMVLSINKFNDQVKFHPNNYWTLQ